MSDKFSLSLYNDNHDSLSKSSYEVEEKSTSECRGFPDFSKKKKENKQAQDKLEMFRLNLTAAHLKYLNPNNYINNNVIMDTDTLMKYYFFLTKGTEADTNSLAPIDSRILDGIDGRLNKDFQKSPFLQKLKTELMEVR
ncbi:Hypothetical protein CINCED_3A000930 [Cinara cedri]|uniref:Uncharacterized protein n=1 Tax=Cinara cedri TaxID=506608 RepID=A0A5E4N794_9HEMI|nr:Hypothetical protein CINCED_3A000930 [Cinara cedri]